MFYYSCYSCRGLAALAYDLNVNDPFALAPAEIVERILMAGYTPAVDLARPDPWSQAGTVTEVHRDGLVFLVAVSREEEMIGLQEARPDPHEPGE
jgi:hypothetical protein